ncbi:MAG: RNA polymerase sigma factor [Chloroflexi bacterium]|nr:RNA polymerase sigma factor [Chloroflexota bacterium]
MRPTSSSRLGPGDEADARNDKELVYAARLGDERAFDALFYRYRDGIFRISLAITKDPRTAEEIVVDTFARAYRALARLEPDDTLRPWLYRVAINESYDRRPRPLRQTSSLDDAAEQLAASEDGSPAALAELAERRRVVLAAVDTLDDKHRTVVVLHYLEQLALAEIADIVRRPVGTVKSRLFYALRRLRTHLSRHPGLAVEPKGDEEAMGER